jgi:O-antigen/teichoic acid export membrane protein
MRQSIQKNLLWMAICQVAMWSGSLVLVVVLPRHVSPSDFGSFQFAAAFVGYFMLVGTFGTTTYLVKMIARDESTVGPFLVNAIVMKLALTISLSAVAILLAYVLGYPSQTIVLVEIACVAMVINVLNETLGAALQGLERMNKFAISRVGQTCVGVGVGLAILLADKGVVAFAIVVPLGAIVPLVVNLIQLWPELRKSLHIDFGVWKNLVKGGMPFLLWTAILVVYGTIDIPLLRAMAGSAAVGAYALAYTWVGMPAGFSSVVVSATMPSMSANAVRESTTDFTRTANRAICLVLLVGLPSSIGIALVIGDVFQLLHYQAGYEDAVVLVQILALHIPFVGMDMVLGSALIAADRQKQWTIIGGGAAVLNPLLNLAAIPITVHLFNNGAIGAAVITVATELFMMVGALAIRPRGIMDRATVSYALRCGLASVLMVPAVLAVGSAVLPVKIGMGVAVYGLASLALGTVSLAGFRGGADGRFTPSRFLNTAAVTSD